VRTGRARSREGAATVAFATWVFLGDALEGDATLLELTLDSSVVVGEEVREEVL
jgi:hypothetical protein